MPNLSLLYISHLFWIDLSVKLSAQVVQGLNMLHVKTADCMWISLLPSVMVQMSGPAPVFVREVAEPLMGTPRFDVVMCGGTLGIFLACALQLQGLRHVATVS